MLSEEDKDAIRDLVLVALQKSDEKEKQKMRTNEDREQLKREKEVLGDRFVFNECEWIEKIKK